MQAKIRTLTTASLVLGMCGSLMAQEQKDPKPELTFYGLMDVAVVQNDGPFKKDYGQLTTQENGATSNVGVKGSYDLGNGLKALLQLETQIKADEGGQGGSGSTFWSGRSSTGLDGAFGTFLVGRTVNPSHYVEASADPFSQNGLAAGVGARGGISQANGALGAIDTVRMNNSFNYTKAFGAYTFRAATALKEDSEGNGNNPISASVIYESGPVKLGISHLNPAKANDDWSYISGSYDFGKFKLHAGHGFGKNTFNQEVRNALIGVSVPFGRGSIMATHSSTFADTTKEASETIQQRFSIGYLHNFTKFASAYVTYVNDQKAGAYAYDKGWAPTSQANSTQQGGAVGLRLTF